MFISSIFKIMINSEFPFILDMTNIIHHLG